VDKLGPTRRRAHPTVQLGRLGVACLTLCSKCAASDDLPPITLGTAARLVVQHAAHVG
jgi:hypothetical protein